MSKRELLNGALDLDEIRMHLHYDPQSGLFAWKTKRKGRRTPLGEDINNNGYARVCISGVRFLMHRVAWAIHYGDWPPNHIDHINGTKTDNRIENLRLASHAENLWNRGKASHNTSGYKGVTWSQQSKKWLARIAKNKKTVHLGSFDCPEAAHQAYLSAARAMHGSFASG